MPTDSPTARRLLDEFQREFPLVPRPYASVAAWLGITEEEVLAALDTLQQAGIVARVGAVLEPNRAGVSTLAAMAVPPPRLVQVAALVSAYAEVNHNYEREHAINLWFVVTAPTRARIEQVLGEIEHASGCAVLDLPLVQPYKLDLGFALQWN